MRKFDFITQTVIIAATLIFIVTGLVREGKIQWFTVIFAQLFIGPWQFLGSSIKYARSLKNPPSLYKTLLSTHFITSTLYLLITLLVMDFVEGHFFQIWIMVIPWILALFYYVLSYLKLRGRHKYHHHKGGFLPHLKL